MANEPTWRAVQELPHPALKAILLCERVIQEARTDSITLVGILNGLTASEFPTEYLRGLALYVRITDSAGDYAVRMEVVRLEDDQTVARADAIISMPDRMTPHEVIFDLPQISLDSPGLYDFRVFANGRFVGDEILLVERAG